MRSRQSWGMAAAPPAVAGGEKEVLLVGSGGAEAVLFFRGEGEQVENGFHR